MEKKQERKEQPNSLPSLRERSESPGALDRRVHWESQEIHVAQSHLSNFVRITGYRRSGCRLGRQESILYAGAKPTTRLLGRQHSDPSLQTNELSQLPKNCVQIQYI